MVIFKNKRALSDAIKLIALTLLKTMPPFGLLLISLYLTEVLTPSGYGSYAVVFSLILFMGPLLTLGISNTVLRKTAINSYKNNYQRADKLFSTSLVICLFVSAVAGVLFYVAISLIDLQRDFIELIYVAPLLAIGLIIAARVRGLDNPVLGQAIEASFRVFLLTTFGIFALFFKSTHDLIDEIYIVSSAFILLFFYFFGGLKEVRFQFTSDFRYLKAIIRNALPNFFILLVQGLKNHGDIFIVAIFLGGSAVGEYAIALQLALIASLAPMIISLLFSRPLAVALNARNYSRVRQYFLYNVWFSATASVVYLLLIATLLPKILQLFVDTDFEYVHSLAIILCVGRLIHACIGPVMQLLILNNQQKIASRISTMIACINVVSLIACVKVIGIYGAAVSTAAVLVIWALFLRCAVKVNIPALNMSFRTSI